MAGRREKLQGYLAHKTQTPPRTLQHVACQPRHDPPIRLPHTSPIRNRSYRVTSPIRNQPLLGPCVQLHNTRLRVQGVQGYLAHKKQPPHKNLQWEYAQGPTVVRMISPRGCTTPAIHVSGLVSYGPGTPVAPAKTSVVPDRRWRAP